MVAVAAALVLGSAVVSMVRSALGPRPLTSYVAPQYWLSYEEGFVRRALPGALLRLVTGGPDPSLALVKAAGVGWSVLAVLAVLVLAVGLARQAQDRRATVAVAAAVVVSPLGLSLYARDLGRPDTVGVVVLVALAALPWRRWPTLPAAAAVAGLTTAAVAAEEFLVGLVVPLGLLVLRSAWAGRRGRGLWIAVTLAPGLVVALLSAALPVPADLLTRALAAARAAGVRPSRPLVPGYGDHDSVSRLGYGMVENARIYYGITTPAGVVATTLLCALLHLLVLGVIWHLLGRSLRERVYLLLTGLPALVALALSVAGIDYRRWWSLALVAALGAVLQQTGERTSRPNAGRALTAALIVLAVAGVALQSMPLWPVRSFAELRTRALN